MKTELCPKCGFPLETGQIVTGQDWSGEGGQHIRCNPGQIFAIEPEPDMERELRG